MRVIAGSAKRIQLRTIEGLETRPTPDRIKETLFNMIQHELYDTVFLDLFSGSGGIGIEALSRGASKAIFVEQNNKAVTCIRENLRNTRLEDKSIVLQSDGMSALCRLDTNEQVDYIYMDPPYNQLLEKQILEYLFSHPNILDEHSLIIIEASKETDFDYVNELGFEIIKIKEYKTNKHVFLEKSKGE